MAPNHFSARTQINKYKLDESTFDLVDVDGFRNTRGSTIFAYFVMWILIFLSWALLGTDIYTCLNILVFHRWSNNDYKPYAYSVAKWIFTGCIIFEFCLLLYHWIWAIHTYKTKNIALVYVNNIARLLYSIRSFNYFCLFNQIEQDNFFDWSCFFCYGELDNALQLLVADTPRQVINILTLRYYATDGETNNNILNNIKTIATTNLTLSIILSLMCVSVIIWSIFFFKFLLGMILYLPVAFKVKSRSSSGSLKKYCCESVNKNVRLLVIKHHKSKRELLDKGILSKKDIIANPLLNSSTTDLENLAMPPSFRTNDETFKKNSISSVSANYNDSFRKPPQMKSTPYELNTMRKDSALSIESASELTYDYTRKPPPPPATLRGNRSLTTLNSLNNSQSDLSNQPPPQQLDVTNMSTSAAAGGQFPYRRIRPPSNTSLDHYNNNNNNNGSVPLRRLKPAFTEPILSTRPIQPPPNPQIPSSNLIPQSYVAPSISHSYSHSRQDSFNFQPSTNTQYNALNHSSDSVETGYIMEPRRNVSNSDEYDMIKDIDSYESSDQSPSSSVTGEHIPYPLNEINETEIETEQVPYPPRGVSVYDYYSYDQIVNHNNNDNDNDNNNNHHQSH
ncbi:uncharacterized protein RJT21DRAFT_120679 [Scheffersomyces amazonensis]|uniref:uncharacterized protein n=1 Tax=Scheffersomyces amazonensis TaxID=1078765 RepID=UPI00315C6743